MENILANKRRRLRILTIHQQTAVKEFPKYLRIYIVKTEKPKNRQLSAETIFEFRFPVRR